MAVLATLIMVFALQIPKSALFFRPVTASPVVPHAAFVTLDDAAYASLMRQVRTADWPSASCNWHEGTMSPAGEFVFEELPPLPRELALPEGFTRLRVPAVPQTPHFRPSLQPPSLAAESPPPLPAAVDPPVQAKGEQEAELLDLENYESLKERK